MLPDDWQFDDAQDAVQMIRALSRHPARIRRIREQFELITELRKDCPEVVLALEYRRLLRKSRATPRSDAFCHNDSGPSTQRGRALMAAQ
jgi:archaeosine-15-forming tRNA-guanine transglycosylase